MFDQQVSVTSTPLICCIHGVPCKKGGHEVRRPSARLGESPTQTPNNSLKLAPTLLAHGNEYENLEPLVESSLIPIAHETISTAPPRRPRELASLTSESGGTQFPKSSTKASCDGVYENIDMGQTGSKVQQQVNLSLVDIAKRSAVKLSDFYIGILTRQQAAGLCNERGAFRLFHKLPSKLEEFRHLKPHIRIYVVYRNSAGQHRFYPIRSAIYKNSSENFQCFFVDSGVKDYPTFTSLTALVCYYSTYVYMKINKDGSIDVDSFGPSNEIGNKGKHQ
ncbi:hypothetical protein M3Y95_00626600 [Aphelenchoides besseyi]|nr:hypothetical protein M3Y95_00626600 [Aphelenchoides besseyi]